jgi:hypothetical protein
VEALTLVRKISPTPGGWRKRLGTPDPNRDVFQHNASRAASAPWNSPGWEADVARQLAERVLSGRRINPSLAEAVRNAIAHVVHIEAQALRIPHAEPGGIAETLAQRAHLRALASLAADADTLVSQWLEALAATFRAVVDAAPPSIAPPHSTFTVPLVERIGDVAALVTRLVRELLRFADDVQVVRPGAALAARVQQNLLRFSKVPEDAARKNPYRLTAPAESGLAGADLLEAYLADTPFLDLLTTPVPFAIPRHAYRAHGCIFAPADHGKTQTLQALIAGFLQEPDPPALFIMDSMGSMLSKLERLQVFDDRLRDRLVILDPTGPNPPRLNFFKLAGGSPAQQTELLFYLFKALDQSFTARQRTAVVFLAQLLQRLDGTLDDLRKICEDKQPWHLEVINALPPIARDFFLNSFYKPDALMTQTKQQIAARLYTLAATPLFEMFSAKQSTLNAFDCIQHKKIVLVNTDRLALGEEGSAIFGRFVIAQVLAAAFARAPIPEDKRHLALLIVDEAKAYLDEQAEKFLSDARQFWVGLLLATQYVHQLEEGVRRAVYGNTAIKLIGPIEYSDRVSLAREMHTTPEFIGSMRAYDRSHTEWAAYVRTSNMTPQALRLRVPYGVLERMPTVVPAPRPAASLPAPVATPRPPANHQAAAPRSAGPTAPAAPLAPHDESAPDANQPFLKPGKDW